MEFKAKWIESNTILSDHRDVEITQVYTWLYTTDKKIIIVSKNGEKWQLPGGHPDRGESLIETAVREAKEETGLDIGSISNNIKVFGYYDIEEYEGNKLLKRFLQVRTILELPYSSENLVLEPLEKDEELEGDKIKFVNAVSIEEAFEKIPWLKTKEEYLTIFNNHLLEF